MLVMEADCGNTNSVPVMTADGSELESLQHNENLSGNVEEMDGLATDEEKPNKCVGCCKACHMRCISVCSPILTSFNPLLPNATRGQRIKYVFMCPPHGKVGQVITRIFACLCIYGSLWSIVGEQALPGGNIFALFILFITCTIGGKIVEKMRLPPLLGMLIVGCILKNVPYIDVANSINPAWSSALRTTALVVILIRAGLGLDPHALLKLSFGVVRLAFLPCIVETITVAICSHLLLGLPWVWGFMLGFILAAVSPAVVVPGMLSLHERGYGLDKGIPTLVIAAASVDDVLAISGFGVVLGITFSSGELALTIAKGPLEAILGILVGIFLGLVMWYIPPKKLAQKTVFELLLLLCSGLLVTFGSRVVHLSGAGPLACLTMAFVAAFHWRKEAQAKGSEMAMSTMFGALWVIFQPLLFGLIGAEVDIMKIQLKFLGFGLAVLCIGLIFRLIVSLLAVFRLGLNLKEKLFIPFAWLPKATVQAAIGSVALDAARAPSIPDPDQIKYGEQLLTVAVLAILITAPIGAIFIAILGPRLLHKSSKPLYEIKVVDTTSDKNGVHDQVSEQEDNDSSV